MHRVQPVPVPHQRPTSVSIQYGHPKGGPDGLRRAEDSAAARQRGGRGSDAKAESMWMWMHVKLLNAR